MVAGGLVGAQSCGLRVVALDVGYSRLAGSSMVRKVIYDRIPVGDELMVIAFGETIGLCLGAGYPISDVEASDKTGEIYLQAAYAIVDFGTDRFIGLVEALEAHRTAGVRHL